MSSVLTLISMLSSSSPQPKRDRLAPRRQRRAAARNAAKTAQKKAG